MRNVIGRKIKRERKIRKPKNTLKRLLAVVAVVAAVDQTAIHLKITIQIIIKIKLKSSQLSTPRQAFHSQFYQCFKVLSNSNKLSQVLEFQEKEKREMYLALLQNKVGLVLQ